MNLLFASTSYPPAIGGAQIHLHQLACQFTNAGHHVQVVSHVSRNRSDWLRMTTVMPDPPQTYEMDGIRVDQLGFHWTDRMSMTPWASIYYLAQAPAVRKIARVIGDAMEQRVGNASWNVVHASRIGREFITQAALDFARRRQIPIVLTPNHHPRWHGRRYREFDRIYRECDALIALTEVEKQHLVQNKGVDAGRIHVTGIGPILADEFSAESFCQQHKLDRYILCLGQQLPYKGIDTLLDAMPIVWQHHPDVSVVFIGPQTAYSRKRFRHVNDARVRNLGKVDLPTKTSAIAGCQVMCLPSRQESFGGVYVEAWQHSKPVIGGDIPPIAEVIDHGVNGYVVPPDPTVLANRLNELLSDTSLRDAMGAAGYEKVQSHYTWPRIAEKTLAIYRHLGAAETLDQPSP